MNKPGKKSMIYVKSNEDFIFFETHSGYWNFLPDPEGKSFLLLHSVSDEELGASLVEALFVSRQIDPQTDPEFFDARGRVVPQYNAWVNEMMGKFEYKTKRKMFQGMKHCSIELMTRALLMKPSNHVKLEAWDAEGITEDDYVSILITSPSEEIGASLRLGLTRCT